MFRAMALKELRETRGIALIGLVLYGLLVTAVLDQDSRFDINPIRFLWERNQQNNEPFVNDIFLGHFWWISAAVAIALGLRQTLGESARATYPLLFHRPATRRWLIGMKLFVGAVVYLVCGAIPILVYGLWAATPGTHASPFEWSMTVPSWMAWFDMLLFYLAAFLTGIRPGRWYGSRLLPLVAAATLLFIVFVMRQDDIVSPLGQLLILITADIWMFVAVFSTVQNRDFS